MPYTKLLRKLLAESDYTSKYIVEECKKRGQKIDKSYFSKLINGKQPPPSEEVSKVLSKIFNVDERLLVIEGYLDKAPKEIVDAFNSIRMMGVYTTLNFFEGSLEEKMLKEAKKELEKMPISEFIIGLIDNEEKIFSATEQFFDKNINGLTEIEDINNVEDILDNFKLNEPVGLEINDNTMFPIIQLGSQVMLKYQPTYETGDILAVKVNGNNDFVIRYTFFNDNKVTLKAVDKKIPVEIYNINDIVILGKVDKVITEI